MKESGSGTQAPTGVPDDAGALSFDIDEQPVLASGTQRLTERTDLPVTGLPRPEPRRMPFWVRLRLLWHRQVLRDAG